MRVGDGERAGRAPSNVSTMTIRPPQHGHCRAGEAVSASLRPSPPRLTPPPARAKKRGDKRNEARRQREPPQARRERAPQILRRVKREEGARAEDQHRRHEMGETAEGEEGQGRPDALQPSWPGIARQKDGRLSTPYVPAAHQEPRTGRAVLEAHNKTGQTVRSRLKTPEGYSLTAVTAFDAARRVAAGKVKPHFPDPSLAFGADYIRNFDRVTREDLNT